MKTKTPVELPQEPKHQRSFAPSVERKGIPFDGIEPQGGGIVTLLADLLMLNFVFTTASRLSNVAIRDTFADGRGWDLAALLCAWIACGTWRTSHRFIRRRGPLHAGWRILSRSAIAISLMVTLNVVISVYDPLPSGFVVRLLIGSVVGIGLLRLLEMQIANWMSIAIHRNKHRILFVGNNRRTKAILDSVKRSPQDRVRVVGLLDPEELNPAVAVSPKDISYIGTLDKLKSFLYGGMVDEVIITLPVRSHYADAERVLHACSEAGIRAHVLSDIFNIDEPRREVSALGGSHAVAYERGPARTVSLAIKRNIDLAGSLFGILMLSPLLILIAIAIKVTSAGPILFAQTRSGRNGRVFQVLKFRTMVEDAEAQKNDLLEKNEMSGPVFKMKWDPRITRVGRILRKYSLDELPQLFNVLKGDMSLVGPRPPLPSEVRDYNFWQLRRLSMRPGLTCLWQVSGRNEIGFEEWMRLDLRYIDNWSLALDFVILMKTIPTVLRGTGM